MRFVEETAVKRIVVTLLALVIACACLLQAQTAAAPSASADLKASYGGIKANLLKAAQNMPEDNYGFKPTPEMRSFGQLIGHIADAQTRFCTAVQGEMKAANSSAKTAKADLVAAMQASIADCDKAYDALTDATAAQLVKMGRGERSRFSILLMNVTHSNESYGYLAPYFRLKGLVPPSSEGR
jgi:hypothetical protein